MVPFVEALAPQIRPERNGSAVASPTPEATALRERVARPVELPGESWPSTATLAGIALAVAGAAIVLVSLALALQLRGDGGSDPGTADAETRRAIGLLSKQSTERIPLEGTKGAVVLAVGTGGLAALVLDDLAPAPAGKAFEAWVVGPAGGPPSPAAVFSGEERVVLLSRPVPAGATVGVTVESAVGVDAPTQRLRLVATRAR
jgi:hypothetical protein